MNLYPAILTESIFELREQLDRLSDVTEQISTIQVDVIDGEFADNITISAIDLIGTDFSPFTVDIHLMVNDPSNYVYECRQVDNVRAVIGQVEHMHSQFDFVQEVKEYNLKPGLSLDLYTPVEAIKKDIWQELTVIQIMGIPAGFQGQTFGGKQVIEKIKEVAKLKKTLDLPQLEIIVDGGVTPNNVGSIARAGADAVGVGSSLWQSKDLPQTVQELLSV